MSTGERWAKLAQAGDDDVISTGEDYQDFRLGTNKGGGGRGSKAVILGGGEDDEEGGFDYGLMYRTYERIPAKERPELPERGDPNFKVVMRELWDRRQKELKAAMERMADVPTVLEELIKDLSSKKEDERIQALEELAYLLSDVDVARDFYVLQKALETDTNAGGGSPDSRR